MTKRIDFEVSCCGALLGCSASGAASQWALPAHQGRDANSASSARSGMASMPLPIG